MTERQPFCSKPDCRNWNGSCPLDRDLIRNWSIKRRREEREKLFRLAQTEPQKVMEKCDRVLDRR